jgi:hypothetical protein
VGGRVVAAAGADNATAGAVSLVPVPGFVLFDESGIRFRYRVVAAGVDSFLLFVLPGAVPLGLLRGLARPLSHAHRGTRP